MALLDRDAAVELLQLDEPHPAVVDREAARRVETQRGRIDAQQVRLARQEAPHQTLDVAQLELALRVEVGLAVRQAVAASGQERVAGALDQMGAVAAGIPADLPVRRAVPHERLQRELPSAGGQRRLSGGGGLPGAVGGEGRAHVEIGLPEALTQQGAALLGRLNGVSRDHEGRGGAERRQRHEGTTYSTSRARGHSSSLPFGLRNEPPPAREGPAPRRSLYDSLSLYHEGDPRSTPRAGRAHPGGWPSSRGRRVAIARSDSGSKPAARLLRGPAGREPLSQ